MAGVHSYPLLVELEETNIPRLKIKLVKYFQSKKSNGGGECEVEYENGSRTAMLRFRREEGNLEKGVLKLTVRLPTEEKSSRVRKPSAGKSNPTGKVETETEGGDDDTADEEPCSTSAVLGNILDNTNQEFLEMLVENITKSHDFTLEFFPDISSKSLSENINKIAKKIHREKSSRTEEIKVSPSVFHLLCQDGLMDKLLLVYPELKLSPESPNLNITGLGEEINAASKVILDAVLALKRQNLEVDKYVLELLKDEQQEELTDALLTSHQINAAFEISGNRVQLLAVSDRDLSHAQDHLGQLLTTQYINVEDSNVLKKPEWQQLVSHLEQANSKPCRTRINTTAQQVVVSGHKERVIKVQHQLGNFLTQNAHIEETVVVKANAVVKYLEDFNKSWMEKVKDKVRVSYRNEAICLSGSRVNVTHCKTVVEGAVSAVVFDSLNVYKSGVKKLFQENETYFSTIKTETDCLVQLVDKPGGGQDNVKQVPTPLYQLKMPGGVEIAVYKADMCSYPIEAVVSPFNQDLKHSTGLAAALLKAAGPQLQDEFYKMKKTKGQLKPGDCVITDAGGTLCCQKVIHAVAPKYEKPLQASAQLNKVVKGSLEFAEAHGCVSVALPSIGRGMRCFPLKQCELTIVKAVKEYCYENYDEITLQKIHFVNNDDIAVQDMVAAARQEFGNLSDSHSQQTPHLTAPTQPVSQSTGSDLCLNRVQTKEGVDIVLTKGNLEASTTEVIVNTVSSDLDLNRGAVSQAILRAAGPKLQQLVDAQGATGNVGEIIVTDGCQLKSKQVFHAIAPHYKDQATSEKCLQGLFLDCLDMAENNNLTSISLPAISTGDLCFPTTVVASLMLDTILEFSKMRHPKHLKMIVIVLYPADTQCIQVRKKFPNASGNSRSTKGPFSKLTSNSDMHETKMGNVTIQVVTGDITKETTDIIVNSSNESFSLKSGVSKAILDAAGKAVEVECHNFSAKSNPGMIMTQPGNLKCKKILHVVGDSDPVKINKVVQDALQMCVKSSYTSVSFPAIGTGEIYSCMSCKFMIWEIYIPYVKHFLNLFLKSLFHNKANKSSKHKSTSDYTKKHFSSSQIERIQNPGLWKSLEIKKREMELRNGHQNNERRLFHGTCDGAVPNINDRGFNRSYAGKNGEIFVGGGCVSVPIAVFSLILMLPRVTELAINTLFQNQL
uniref:Poly(ADP-ribose) polymerase family member 14-related sequence 1 n=1 Tax=Neolamprologus brichardi TaxID=32507 RepID=A0A3Q4HSS3_NEOBR